VQRALRAGDPGALRLVYDLYGGLAYSLALRIVGDSGRAEEVVQDVMTSLWRKPDRFDPERGSFRTWLLTVTRNRSIDALRGGRKRREAETQLVPETRATSAESDPWHLVSVGLERTAIREALESIPADQREAIELSYFAGLSQSDIAERLGLPLGTVKGRQRLGLEKLHSYLTGRGLMS
jgi:RNA polymerase sigma-70 factor (ECF subfamily)